MKIVKEIQNQRSPTSLIGLIVIAAKPILNAPQPAYLAHWHIYAKYQC